MDVARLLRVAAAVAVAVLAIPVADAQDDEEIAAQASVARGAPKPWKFVRGLGRVLDLSRLPVVIDEPGNYAIQRNWQIPSAASQVNTELIRITADNVTLDLHGFEISADGISAPPVTTLLVITGRAVEIRNGGLSACCEGGGVVHSTGFGTKMHHLTMYSHETMSFTGDGASLTDSDFHARVQVRFAARSTLERNAISCNRGHSCVVLVGDGNSVANNRMSLYQGGGIEILGDRNLLAANVVDVTDAVDAFEPFEVAGDSNIVRDNTVFLGGTIVNASAIFVISGTANTLDGNIAAPATPTERARIGMAFTADGNYYGDNRMAAQVPFALGGTVQTDWGD